MLQYRHLTKPAIIKKARNAFAITLCEHATKKSFFTYQHIRHALNLPKIRKIFNNPRFKRLEFTFDCASSYQSEEMIYNVTVDFARRTLPRRFDSIRYSPQCHCHGKSNLDRRFSSLTTWKRNWENDDFHDTIVNMEELRDCYISGRDQSNISRVTIDHKEPIVTEVSIIDLKRDDKARRPYVRLVGMQSTNSITLITDTHLQCQWKLYNSVLPHVAVNRGRDITSHICEGEDGKLVTPKMADPGAKRKPINLEDNEDPKVIASQFKTRTRFIKQGMLKNYIEDVLKLAI